jgi:hypothetical protein
VLFNFLGCVMAVINFAVLSELLNSSFLYGFIGGFSVAWVLLKSRTKMHEESTVLPSKYYACDEVSCIAAVVFRG